MFFDHERMGHPLAHPQYQQLAGPLRHYARINVQTHMAIPPWPKINKDCDLTNLSPCAILASGHNATKERHT
jgi:hypothetical protein